MSKITFFIVVAVIGVAACMSIRAAESRVPSKLDLASVLNKTVCPISVEIDEDLSRIPKRIKVMKCARDPNQWCSKMHIPQHECCQHQHDNVKLECVEMQDVVQVYYPDKKLTQPYRVSVGCSCIMQETHMAGEVDPTR